MNRGLTQEQAEAGVIPAKLTPQEWRAMHRTSAEATAEAMRRSAGVADEAADLVDRLIELTDRVTALEDECSRLRQVLTALRTPSDAVMRAAALCYSGDLKDAVQAAAAAAEREVACAASA